MDTDARYLRKRLTIITETMIETVLTQDLDRLGATGYTITNARGRGHHGVRDAGWEASGNIRIEVICNEDTARRIASHLQANYYDDYAMIMLLEDVEVLRPEKF